MNFRSPSAIQLDLSLMDLGAPYESQRLCSLIQILGGSQNTITISASGNAIHSLPLKRALVEYSLVSICSLFIYCKISLRISYVTILFTYRQIRNNEDPCQRRISHLNSHASRIHTSIR